MVYSARVKRILKRSAWLHLVSRRSGIFFCCPSVFNGCISIHEWPVRCTVAVRLLRTDGACCGTGAHLKVRTWNCSVDCLSRFPVYFFFCWLFVSNRIPNHFCCFGGELDPWDDPSFVIMAYLANVSRI